jgi:glutamate synthase domain-containing protein 2
VFKALALGAPYTKAVCMGRALMIPGMVGKNTEKWIRGEDGGLPATVSRFGDTKEEIFMNYEVLKERYGAEAENLPLGAIGIFSATDKIKVGLQQLMAGSRNWKVEYISRGDLMSLTEECTRVTAIPYVMEAYRDEAYQVIDA